MDTGTIIDHTTHADAGAIRIGLVSKHSEAVARSYIGRIRDRIHQDYIAANPHAQIFEEGPVLLHQPPRPPLGRASEWLMDFRAETCARMHTHPFGERVVRFMSETPFEVWSVTPIEMTPEIEAVARRMQSNDPETGKPVYGVMVRKYTEFVVHIPKDTSHRFKGGGIAFSAHPDELSEIAQTGNDPNMSRQTHYWAAEETTPDICNMNAGELTDPGNPIAVAQMGGLQKLSVEGWLTDRDIFQRLDTEGKRTSLRSIFAQLMAWEKEQSPFVQRVESLDEATRNKMKGGRPASVIATTLRLREDGWDAFREAILARQTDMATGR